MCEFVCTLRGVEVFKMSVPCPQGTPAGTNVPPHPDFDPTKPDEGPWSWDPIEKSQLEKELKSEESLDLERRLHESPYDGPADRLRDLRNFISPARPPVVP
jgi:hypothetical protein